MTLDKIHHFNSRDTPQRPLKKCFIQEIRLYGPWRSKLIQDQVSMTLELEHSHCKTSKHISYMWQAHAYNAPWNGGICRHVNFVVYKWCITKLHVAYDSSQMDKSSMTCGINQANEVENFPKNSANKGESLLNLARAQNTLKTRKKVKASL